MSVFQPAETLRRYRALFLACEAIGWLHMAGKAKADFLRRYGGAVVNYDYQRWYEQETPPFPWDDLLGWIKERFAEVEGVRINWPDVPARFITEHTKQNPGMLGLLQAGHAIASGVEKQSYPDPTIWYLSQDVTHMWLSSAFGRPTRNLLADPPEALTGDGWKRLVEEIRHILEELKSLGTGQVADVGSWRSWRDRAIGPQSFLRRAFLSTAAETRLPNNDVTLWDQSYVAAALFKSAVAGAVLEASKRKTFPWDSSRLKQLTRWRLLTVGIGTDHYEARAVKIGDWKGAEADVQRFFDRVCVLIEVDLAVGSLLYQDTSVAVFSFPGERYDEGDFDDRTFARWLEGWEEWLQEQVNGFARELQLETPPYLKLSRPTRSLVPMARQMRKARAVLAVPVHRPWKLSTVGNKGHVCPVCQVRLNDDPKRKSHPCKVCERRRTGRLDAWLSGKLGSDTIWMDEVADHNGRVALLTLSLDLDPWLEGDRVDSLRTQAISEWRRFNPVLKNQANPIDTKRPFESMLRYLLSILNQRTSEGDYQYNWNDPVLSSLSRGFPWEPRLHPSGTSGEVLWRSFFNKLVEDRARDEVSWDILKEDEERARWLAHQLFTKLPSPGRIYRFWRQAEGFFQTLLQEFRQIAARSENRWRTRRLMLISKNSDEEGWRDRAIYDGRWRGAPVSLLYREDLGGFLTICNLARLLGVEENTDVLRDIEIKLKAEDAISGGEGKILKVTQVKRAPRNLGVYHPLILLELSPFRFRALVPLEAASECVDRAIAAWREEFGRVWDRLPLRVGLVTFHRTTPLQAVIEMARNLEADLEGIKPAGEVWQVLDREIRDGVAAISFKREDGEVELGTFPIALPDGRLDVFYPYVAVEGDQVRLPHDFQHPEGQLYRHVKDLQHGDRVRIYPSRIATVFLDSTARRFELPRIRYLSDWIRMREVWQLVQRLAPSETAIHMVWNALLSRWEEWRLSGEPEMVQAKGAWRKLARALLQAHLNVRGASLEALVEAACNGLLFWALEWHISTLKQRTGRGET